MDLAELEKQVTLQEDIQEIENLQKMYGYFFDNVMYQEVMDLFSENVESVEITDHGVFRGKDAVSRAPRARPARSSPFSIEPTDS